MNITLAQVFLNSLLKKLRLFPNKIRQDIIHFQQNCNASIIATHRTLACSSDSPESGSAKDSRSQNCITLLARVVKFGQ